MKYGDKYKADFMDTMTGKVHKWTVTYRRTEWHGYHTDNEGNGLWIGDRQIMGTCDFSVAGCATEKSAKAKIRNAVKDWCEYRRSWCEF